MSDDGLSAGRGRRRRYAAAVRPTASDDDPCPCGRGGSSGPLAFRACCGGYLAATDRAAPDAESLMRSRYSAYVRRDTQYLLATWHPATRPDRLDLDDDVTWLGLEIREAGERHVEFAATYRGPDGRVGRLHERSRFVRQGGRWLYVEGDVR